MRRNNNNECSIVESNNETEKEMICFFFVRETLIKEILASMVGWFSICFTAFFFLLLETVIAIKKKLNR